MDHIQIEDAAHSGRAQSQERIPYICEKRWNVRPDGALFFELGDNSLSSFNELPLQTKQDLEDSASYIQAQFWFGLLCAALGAGKRDGQGEMIGLSVWEFLDDPDPSEPRETHEWYLSTNHLMAALEDREQQFDISINPDAVKDLVHCLWLVRQAIVTISERLKPLEGQDDLLIGVNLNWQMLISCGVLWETIYNAFEGHIRIHPLNQGAGRAEDFREVVEKGIEVWDIDRRLERAGWDPELIPKDTILRHHLLAYPCRKPIGTQYDSEITEPETKFEVCPSKVRLFHYNRNGHLEAILKKPEMNLPPYVAILYLPALIPSPRPQGSISKKRMLRVMQDCTDQLLVPQPGVLNRFWVDPKFFSSANTTDQMPSVSQNITAFKQAKYIVVMDPFLYDLTPIDASQYQKLLRVRCSQLMSESFLLLALQQSAQAAPNNLMFLFGIGENDDLADKLISHHVLVSLASLRLSLLTASTVPTREPGTTGCEDEDKWQDSLFRHGAVPKMYLPTKKIPVLVEPSNEELGLPERFPPSTSDNQNASMIIELLRRDLSYGFAQMCNKISVAPSNSSSDENVALPLTGSEGRELLLVLRVATLTLPWFRAFLHRKELRHVASVWEILYSVYVNGPGMKRQGLRDMEKISRIAAGVSWEGGVESDVSLLWLPKQETGRMMKGVVKRLRRILELCRD